MDSIKLIIVSDNPKGKNTIGFPVKNVTKETIYVHKDNKTIEKVPDYLIVWEHLEIV